MQKTLFLQSEVRDPYLVYKQISTIDPIYWDEENKLWAIYSYADCKSILQNPYAAIPVIHHNNENMNEYALLMSGKFARFSNGLDHEIARYIVMQLFNNIKNIFLGDMISQLINNSMKDQTVDWVHAIGKKLPMMAVLRSFDFNTDDTEYILDKMEQFKIIMLPSKTPEEIAFINEVSIEIYAMASKQLTSSKFFNDILSTTSEKYKSGVDEIVSSCISNLIGLMIQSYDAGCGLLSNSLLQEIRNNQGKKYSSRKGIFEASVIETLRFDPPVQNTRRIALHDITLNDRQIRKGDLLLVILAAANRDPGQFYQPNIFNTSRKNNNDHLTYGGGAHRCPAHQFSTHLAAKTLGWVFEKYKRVCLLKDQVEYEPLVNARLPVEMYISLS